MAWRENEALEAVLQSLLTFRSIHGAEKLSDLLEHELGREAVLRRIEADRKASATPPVQHQQFETAVAALEFYADVENHTPRKGQQVSAVARDKGRIARDALASIGGENGEDAE